MKKTLILAAAAVISFAPVAGAVDIVNEDDTPVMVLIDDGSNAKEIEIGAGETVEGACEACVIQVGEEAVDAEGAQVVKIKGKVPSVGG